MIGGGAGVPPPPGFGGAVVDGIGVIGTNTEPGCVEVAAGPGALTTPGA